MKTFLNTLAVVSLLFSFGCSSTKTAFISKHESFNSKDLFAGGITIYPALNVITTNTKIKTSATKAKDEIAIILKNELESAAPNADIIIGKSATSGLSSFIDTKKIKEIISSSKTKYSIVVRQILLGDQNDEQSVNNSYGTTSSYDYGKVTTTVFFEVWDNKNKLEIYSCQVDSDVRNALLFESIRTSLENTVDEFIESISKN